MNRIGRRITDKIIEINGSDEFSIAFLPYKRSMWNSMQSVFEECLMSGIKAYCLPLPYYKMKSGKEIDRIEYEKELFENAQDISLLGKLHFDYVVIHYPYDHNNTVTSMLPAYHTDQLRKYGKIIYIPYSCFNSRQLRVQPGLANIDYAFLGTSQEAYDFIKEWQEFGVDFSGRVFGLGSPKMDSIQKTIREDADKTLIINSLAAYLVEPFIRINKYKREIQGQIDAGHEVIFRPHPLLRQTIKALRPDTETYYDDFIKWAENIGCIVDESEFLEDALEQANYMIGDPSSVLDMWISTGREFKII